VGDVYDVTPLHLLACWSPDGEKGAEDKSQKNSSSSSSNSRASVKTSSHTRSTEASSSAAAAAGSSSSAADAATAATAADAQKGLQEQLAAARMLISGLWMPDGHFGGRCKVDAVTSYAGETALTIAAGSGAVELAKLLLANGANVNLPRTLDAARPIDIAVEADQLLVACLLLEHGAEVSMQPDAFLCSGLQDRCQQWQHCCRQQQQPQLDLEHVLACLC
jgi:hypothetical protein